MPTTALAPIFAQCSYSRRVARDARFDVRQHARERARRALQEEFARRVPDEREWDLAAVETLQPVTDDEQRWLLGGLLVLKRPEDAEVGEHVAESALPAPGRFAPRQRTLRRDGEYFARVDWELREVRLRGDLPPVRVWERVA